jgi:hypothetical protein
MFYLPRAVGYETYGTTLQTLEIVGQPHVHQQLLQQITQQPILF